MIRALSAAAGTGAVGLIAQDRAFQGVELKGGWDMAVWAVLVAAPLVAFGTTSSVLRLIRAGPQLEISKTIGEEHRYTGNVELLQVVYGAILNARESGGERATARELEPVAEAINPAGDVVSSTRGSWGYEHDGSPIKTITLRPTRAEQPIELVAKYPGAERAWIAGARHPELWPGIYTLRITVRGEGLRKPAVFEWEVINPGSGGELQVRPLRGPGR